MRFTLLPHALNPNSPLIYMWEIHDAKGVLLGRYVGKAKAGASRPLKYYKRNVTNILLNKPYRKGSPIGYRRIHRALADAECEGLDVTLRFLRNVAPSEDNNEVERDHIRAQNSLGAEAWQLNG